MDTNEVLHEILQLQKESNERDTKIETTLTYFDIRLSKQEEILERLSNTMNEQRNLQDQVEKIQSEVVDNKKAIKSVSERVYTLEHAPAEKAYKTIKKVLWIIVPLVVSGVIAILLNGVKTWLTQ